ncbi:MAG: 4-(cytidine 5'-diphospho)-2-C-methyl-D-erythritol kinase [Acidimicrobiales bacterium]
MVTLLAPAKLTVSLRLTGLRDDGMHLIDAEMVSVDLYDTLVVTDGHGVVMDGPAAGSMRGETDGTDLVSAALRLAGREARVVVDKQIPAGAGLGGGSGDAAAILQWAGFTDVEAAARIGADVAFCLVGGRARVRGIGEILEPLPVEPRTFTLLTPPIHCSTPVVYRQWDAMGGPTAGPDAVEPNDLVDAALAAYPAMAGWRDELAKATGLTPRLAGSGSTWFVEGAFPGDGRRVVHTVGGANERAAEAAGV